MIGSGQQVAAGDVLLVIDSSGEEDSEVGVRKRLQFRELPDPLERLFQPLPGGGLGEPDLLAADRAAAAERRSAIEAAREEVRRVLKKKGVVVLSAGADEAPMAYKNINEVMAAQADLVTPIARFDPSSSRWRLEALLNWSRVKTP